MKLKVTSVAISKKGRIYLSGELLEVPVDEIPKPDTVYTLREHRPVIVDREAIKKAQEGEELL